MHGSGGVWSAPRRLSTSAGDMLPTIVATGRTPRIEIAFQRTLGRARGIYEVTSTRGAFTRAARIRGSNALDVDPVLAATRSGYELAFARGGPKPGIYVTTFAKRKWAVASRLTESRDDIQPTLAIDPAGVSHIVFRRTAGRGAHGLFELRSAGRTWSIRYVTGTTAFDQRIRSRSTARSCYSLTRGRQPRLPASTTTRRQPAARWLSTPQRWSSNPNDDTPSLRATAGGNIVLIFGRR